ncbi:hypothetical protein EPH95_01550 [Salicibibacter halophilus]|uniref:DUF2202 domain-containing protein n=1 Tax=Salicibibacter halophilus TaxID=2502791 RepID=A0A514LDU5_9BACI|nr:hypothetical protein [Salicibibacter halophilus]QDI90019.1 hypothetical protein EPH95_01550 [Salicibibacter halophilus]
MRLMKGSLVIILLMLAISGCGSENAEDLEDDLARMEYVSNPGVEHNELYRRDLHDTTSDHDEIKEYSNHYSAFLEQFHEELESLYGYVDELDESGTKASVGRLSGLVDDITDMPTPPEFYDLRDVTLGSLVEMNAVDKNISECTDGGTEACDLTRSYTENLTEYLRTMEYTHQAKLDDFGLVS